VYFSVAGETESMTKTEFTHTCSANRCQRTLQDRQTDGETYRERERERER